MVLGFLESIMALSGSNFLGISLLLAHRVAVHLSGLSQISFADSAFV
jgi:hypothetical protein